MTPEASLLLETIQWCLVRRAVDRFVVARVEPSCEVTVEFLERDGMAGTNLAFELVLSRFNDSFDDASGRRFSRRPV